MPKAELREYFGRIGRKGGRSGRGKSKRRGDSEYYRRLSRKGRGKHES